MSGRAAWEQAWSDISTRVESEINHQFEIKTHEYLEKLLFLAEGALNMRGKLRSSYAYKAPRAYRNVPDTLLVRAFHHGESDAKGARWAARETHRTCRDFPRIATASLWRVFRAGEIFAHTRCGRRH